MASKTVRKTRDTKQRPGKQTKSGRDYVLYYLADVCRSLTDVVDEMVDMLERPDFDFGLDVPKRVEFLRKRASENITVMEGVIEDLHSCGER